VAIAECEKRLAKEGRRVVVITQNIDELHARAGSTNIIELHGNGYHIVHNVQSTLNANCGINVNCGINANCGIYVNSDNNVKWY